MDACVLVLDQGGHSSRALVFGRDGTVLARAAVAVSTHHPRSGWVEQDPCEILTSLQVTIAQVATQLGERCHDLQAAALIVQRSSLLAWDRITQQVLSPVLSWQDTRNSSWLEACLAGKRDSLRTLTGLYANAHYGASKMRWLLEHVPAVQAAAANSTLCIAPLASFLQQQLTHAAEPAVDAVIASRTLLTALAATEWSAELLSLFGIPADVLPVIKPTVADYGAIAVGACSVPLRLLGGDQSFFSLAHPGFFDEHTLFINAGTGAFVQKKITQPTTVPQRLLVAPLSVGNDNAGSIVVAEGTVNAAATALDWFWQQAGCSFSAEHWCSAEEQARQYAAVPLFCNRVTASGSPDWLPAGESFFSMDAPLALQAVAVLESIVFALQRNIDCLAVSGQCQRLVVSGGLSQSGLFCSRLATVTRMPVLRSDDAEACARGAAMQLLPQTGWLPDYVEYQPQPDVAVQQRYSDWTALMDQLARAG